MDHLCYLCLVFVMLLRLFVSALWSPAGKGLTSWVLFVMFNCVFVTFPCDIMCHVLYLIFIDSFLLLSFLQLTTPVVKVTYICFTFNFCFLFMKSSMGG